ncbi:ADP/ATP translocase 4 [Halictus rubicundus]|uniref:ADP/ATP translocase 4 n=1 Tax=Halictus rubicundus TaxID=77578 RepID=UPI004037091A
MQPRKSRAINDDFAINPALDGQCVQINVAADFGVSFFISGMLSVMFKTLTAPLERIKLILQTQTSSPQIGPSQRSAYSGFFDAAIRIPREQGFLSLWRGNTLNMCRYFPAQAINFSFFDLYYKAYQRIIEPKTALKHNLISFLAGGSVGVTSCVLLYPLSFCITRISVDIGDNMKVKREFSNFKDCASKIYKNDGYRGFYQGILCSATGMFVYRSIYFGAYMVGKQWYSNQYKADFQTVPVMVSVFFAHLAGTTATIVSYPFDTISRQKMLHSGHGPAGYVSSRKLIARIMENDGLIGFYRGIFANLLATVCGSFILVSYDLVIAQYEKFKAQRMSRKFENSESPDVR